MVKIFITITLELSISVCLMEVICGLLIVRFTAGKKCSHLLAATYFHWLQVTIVSYKFFNDMNKVLQSNKLFYNFIVLKTFINYENIMLLTLKFTL